MIRDGGDSKKAAQFLAPEFEHSGEKGRASNVIHIANGDTTSYVAKAGTQTGEAIPGITFDWESEHSSIVDVTDGVIIAEDTTDGPVKITVTAVGRGIEVELMVNVISAPAKIAIAGDSEYHIAVGGHPVALKATVTDGGTPPKEITGGITVTWHVSDPAVVSVNGEGSVSGVGEGTATVWAKVGTKLSNNRITFHVSSFAAPSQRLRVAYTDDREIELPALDEDDNPATIRDETTTPNALAGEDAAGDELPYSLTVFLETRNEDGAWARAPDGTLTDDLTVNVSSSNEKVIDLLTASQTLTMASGTVTVPFALNPTAAGDDTVAEIVGFGTTNLTFNASNTIATSVPVTVTKKE